MQMHAMRPGAGWSWLKSGFTVARRDPGKILGATVLFLLCASVPSVVQVVLKPRGTALLVMFGAMMLVGAVLYPLLIGGFMRIIDASRNGRPVRVLTLFEPFRPGQGGGHLVLFGICLMVVYAIVLALLLTTVGHGVLSWYLQLVAQQASGAPPQALPALPHGFSLTLALLTVFFIFYSGAYAVGVGQAALRSQSGLAALRDGMSGAFRNVLPLVVLAICGLLVLIVLVLLFGVVATILVLLGGLVSKVAGVVLAGVVYVVLLLLVVPFMMGVNYAIWHDVADAGSSDPAPAGLSDVQG